MNDHEKVIRDFIHAWSRLDPDELTEFFTDDGIYYNMPMEPVQGRDKINDFIRALIGGWTGTEWELVHILTVGNLVMAERVDKTKAGEKSVELPCVGVFEMEEGKIKVWRDYFDLGTYMKGIS